MKLTNVALAVVLVWAGATWAQNVTTETAPASMPMPAPNSTANNMQAPPAPMGQNQSTRSNLQNPEMGRLQRMQEMQDTLSKMHELLKDMQAKVASSNPKSQSAMMDNVQMWQLILEHLDHNMAQARTSMMLRGSEASPGARRNMTRRSGVARTPAMPAPGGSAAPK
jgi:hypothetical protein